VSNKYYAGGPAQYSKSDTTAPALISIYVFPDSGHLITHIAIINISLFV
jgi:hypothetical protein